MYHFDNEARKNFYASFEQTEETVAEQIKTIKIWLETQTHLPEIMDDAKIRNMLHLCKFNAEKVKERVENYYTFRTKYPNISNSSNPKSQSLKETMETVHMCNHPQLVDSSHRAVFVSPKKKNVLSCLNIIKLYFCIYEIRLQEDLMIDDIIIVDMTNITFRDMCTLSPRMVLAGVKIYKNTFSMRLRAMYFINSPSYVSIWMPIFKLFFPAKIFDRLQVHRDSEILKDLFSPNDLPKDYGGSGPSLDQLNVNEF
ncbi:clavesin-1-like isoform X2 [Zophobas morio]|uniref:clavesin-1-like isoform X2 n=1 Tax=Zophobas morio TaxID=2755281 RepID=UPI003083AB6E